MLLNNADIIAHSSDLVNHENHRVAIISKTDLDPAKGYAEPLAASLEITDQVHLRPT